MSKIREDAQAVKTAFIKTKYIEAAKAIILHDGVRQVTVRRIAEITEYSYPMIYHYFRDLNALLLETKLSMIHDMTAADGAAPKPDDDPLECKKRQARQMIGFFIRNPHIFTFFYQTSLNEDNISAMRSLELEKAYYDDFAPFVDQKTIRKEDVPAISRAITFLVFGAVTLCLSNNGLTQEEAMDSVDNTIDLLLGGKGRNGEG